MSEIKPCWSCGETKPVAIVKAVIGSEGFTRVAETEAHWCQDCDTFADRALWKHVAELGAAYGDYQRITDATIKELREALDKVQQERAEYHEQVVMLEAERDKLAERAEELEEALTGLLETEWAVTPDWGRKEWEKAVDIARQALKGGEDEGE